MQSEYVTSPFYKRLDVCSLFNPEKYILTVKCDQDRIIYNQCYLQLTLMMPKHISHTSPSCQVPVSWLSTTLSTIASTALTEFIFTMYFLLNIANKSK